MKKTVAGGGGGVGGGGVVGGRDERKSPRNCRRRRTTALDDDQRPPPPPPAATVTSGALLRLQTVQVAAAARDSADDWLFADWLDSNGSGSTTAPVAPGTYTVGDIRNPSDAPTFLLVGSSCNME